MAKSQKGYSALVSLGVLVQIASTGGAVAMQTDDASISPTARAIQLAAIVPKVETPKIAPPKITQPKIAPKTPGAVSPTAKLITLQTKFGEIHVTREQRALLNELPPSIKAQLRDPRGKSIDTVELRAMVERVVGMKGPVEETVMCVSW